MDGDALANAVSEWMTRYDADGEPAMLELINLILEVGQPSPMCRVPRPKRVREVAPLPCSGQR